MKALEQMVGETIYAVVPSFDASILQRFTLRKIEFAGVWVEHIGGSNFLSSKLAPSFTPETVFFLPWHEIRMLWGSVDAPSLDEKSIGL